MNPAAGFKPIYLRVFFPFALGYFISFLFRVVNAVIGPDLTADLGLGPDDLGLLTAAYFITFAAAQLPLGILLDRFGPRRIETGLLLIAAAGAVIFSQARSLTGLVIGRGLVGLGVSACLMAAFTAYARWFPSARLPLINSFQMTAGGLGVLTATTPVQAALKVTDWRGIFLLLAAITLTAAIGIIAAVPRRPAAGAQIRWSDQLRGTLNILKTPMFWQIVPWATLSQAVMMSLQGLWTGPWLRDVAGMGRDQSARVLMGMALGMVAGYLTMGLISDRLGRRGIPPRWVAAGGMALFLVSQGMVLWVTVIPIWLVWIAFTFFGTSGILCYADLSQRFPTHMTGRANTALNLLVFIAAFALQWGIGVILDQWPRTPQGGYAPRGYQVAFTLLWLLQLAGAGWFLAASHRQRQIRPC